MEKFKNAYYCVGILGEWADSQMKYATILERIQPLTKQNQQLTDELAVKQKD